MQRAPKECNFYDDPHVFAFQEISQEFKFRSAETRHGIRAVTLTTTFSNHELQSRFKRSCSNDGKELFLHNYFLNDCDKNSFA